MYFKSLLSFAMSPSISASNLAPFLVKFALKFLISFPFSAVAMSVDQDVQMTNDNSIVNPYTSPSSAGKTIDPGTYMFLHSAKMLLSNLYHSKHTNFLDVGGEGVIPIGR